MKKQTKTLARVALCVAFVAGSIATPAAAQSSGNYGQKGLHFAALAGNVAAVQSLLSTESVHAQDAKGYTPLHYAFMMKHEAVARVLISKGANPKSTGGTGTTTPCDLGMFAGAFRSSSFLASQCE
jgi:ankyrin repeat protein